MSRSVLPVVVAAVLSALVQPDPASGQVHWSRYSVRAGLAGSAPVLDGVLDDAVWASAGTVDGFVQQEPREGAPASEATEVLILYDSETLYFGIRAWHAGADGIAATEMRRDSDRILDEDNIQIILDTFKDSRTGYTFVTNPLGAQLDQQVFNEGEGARPGYPTSNVNRDWDGVWEVEARSDAEGWTVEIAIPMVTLRFPSGPDQSWGLNIMRNIAGRNEQSFWAPVPKEFTLDRVSLAGSLEGMTGLSRGRDLRVTPFVTGGPARLERGSEVETQLNRSAGFDVKVGLTAGLNLDLTVNTDFAQAEVDDEQVNLTRFPIFFPEKRDFFLENSGQFNVGSLLPFQRYVDLFFSRRIGLTPDGRQPIPIRGGARLTGKVGQNDIAVMDVQTDSAFGRSGDNFLVAKYSRNFMGRSRVGALVVDKRELDGPHFNRTYAADLTLAPHPNFTVVGFLARTETPDSAAVLLTESDDVGETAGYVNATWLDAKWRVYGEYIDLDGRFNPEVGYIQRRGVRTTKLHIERNPRPDRWGIRVLQPMFNWSYTTDQEGRRLADRFHYMLGVDFQNGARFNMWYNDHFDRVERDFAINGVTIPAGDYDFGEWRFSFDSSPARRTYYSLELTPQGYYDGDRTDASATVGFRVSDRFSTEAQYQRNDVSLPDGSFVVGLAALRLDFAISPTMNFRALAQQNSLTDQFGTSVRFRWTYQPGSDLFIVYDEIQRDPDTMMEYHDRRLALKATYLITR